MIFRRKYLDGIASGAVTLAFRRWVRPTVKPNGTLRTAIGVLRIGEVRRVVRASITEREANAAGYETLAALLTELDQRTAGEFYRIGVSLEGPDPRVAPRENATLSPSGAHSC